VGAAARGPVDQPVRVFSFAEYQRTFGGILDEARPMGHAVSLYFANGGAEALIVRAAHGDAKAAHVDLQDAVPGTVLTLTANGKGEWANRTGGVGMEVEVAYDNISNPDDLFRMVITYWIVDSRTNQPVKGAEETYLNLSMSPAHPRYVMNALATSQLVVPSVPALTAGPPQFPRRSRPALLHAISRFRSTMGRRSPSRSSPTPPPTPTSR
jgi:hypothetical protein